MLKINIQRESRSDNQAIVFLPTGMQRYYNWLCVFRSTEDLSNYSPPVRLGREVTGRTSRNRVRKSTLAIALLHFPHQ